MPTMPGPSRTELAGLPPEGGLLDGKYRLGPTIGRGGMALVVQARHLGLDERVALKVLLPEHRGDPNVVQRFLREGRAATKIRSEHVVRMLDVAAAPECPYLVMEYLDGRDLQALLAGDGPLPTTTAVDYILQACEAIAEAHTCGIIHRDLKPANMFLTHRADGSACVKVLDFGISKVNVGVPRVSGLTAHATLADTVMGSPHYMSPEQMESPAGVDARSDIWSLGTIVYELIAGRSAFDGDSITELCARILKGSPTPLVELRSDVPRALDAVVFRCLEKEPARRYANVAQLASALAGFGTAAAHASALRIARVIGVGSDVAPPESGVADSLDAREPPAAGPTAPRRRVGGYLVALLAVVAAGIGIRAVVGARGGAPVATKGVELRTMEIVGATRTASPVEPTTAAATAVELPTARSAAMAIPSALPPRVPRTKPSARTAGKPEPEPELPVFAPPSDTVVSPPYTDNPFAGGGAPHVGVAPAADDGGA